MNLTSNHFLSPWSFNRSTQLDINPQREKWQSSPSTYPCHFQVEVSDCQKIKAEQWQGQNSPIKTLKYAANTELWLTNHCGKLRLDQRLSLWAICPE